MSSEQQPVLVYPNTVTSQSSSSHKNESFGAVFIVLAVIVLVSAIACFLGRLCSRRYHHPKSKQSHAPSRPKEREAKQKHTSHAREGDIEFGFDKGIPDAAKPFGNGEARRSKPAGYHNNGEIFKGEPRFAYEGELKAGDYNTA